MSLASIFWIVSPEEVYVGENSVLDAVRHLKNERDTLLEILAKLYWWNMDIEETLDCSIDDVLNGYGDLAERVRMLAEQYRSDDCKE